MEGWLIALLIKPLALLGFLHVNGKVHGFLYRVLPEGKLKTALLRER
jgi:hypothetical protein